VYLVVVRGPIPPIELDMPEQAAFAH
jgi:hypothetical protein